MKACDRREYIPHPAELPIHWRRVVAAGTEAGRRDASAGGICFASLEHLEPDSAAEVLIPTPAGAERFRVRVAWSRPELDGFLIGVRFCDARDAFRARLVEQVCHIEAYRRRENASGRRLSTARAADEWIPRFAHRIPQIA